MSSEHKLQHDLYINGIAFKILFTNPLSVDVAFVLAVVVAVVVVATLAATFDVAAASFPVVFAVVFTPVNVVADVSTKVVAGSSSLFSVSKPMPSPLANL